MRFLRSLAGLVALGALAGAAACGSKANAVTKGGECEVTSDCDVGLVCVPQKSGTRICTDDLSGVQQTPTTPARDAGRQPTDASGTDAPTVDAQPAPTPDADQPDTSPTPVPDAASD